MHLWEIKTESRNEKTFTIKFKEQKICDIEIEMICLYGQFGYGYSHQLANLCDRSTFQQIEESIFFRLPGIDVCSNTNYFSAVTSIYHFSRTVKDLMIALFQCILAIPTY